MRGVNYLEREARNASLGAAGEQFVLEVEDRRLREAGKGKLAAKIEHVSISQGDGLGYDIISFETDGRERFIEVKTTSFAAPVLRAGSDPVQGFAPLAFECDRHRLSTNLTP